MDVKQYQDSLDPLEGRIKTEPDIVSVQNKDQTYSRKPQMLKNEYGDVLDDSFNFVESQCTDNFVNVGEIKQEILECGMPKIDGQYLNLPIKTDHDMACDNVLIFPMTIKNEPERTSDFHEVKAEDMFVDIYDINKQEVSDFVLPKNKSESTNTGDFREIKVADLFVDISDVNKQEANDFIQPKNETELLNTHCDLPTLKDEFTNNKDYFTQPGSSKQRILKPSKKMRKRYECPVCQIGLPSSKSRSTHIDGHFGKRFVVCRYCGKLFKNIEYFQHSFIHGVKNKIEIHINNHPFKYNIFSEELKQNKIEDADDKSTLQRHLILHKKVKPFKCDNCFQEFSDTSSLQNHLISHTNEKPFKCSDCSKAFAKKFSLQRHLIIHSDENPFKCDICSKTFKWKFNLQQHLIIHSNIKPFQCDICFKEFKRKYILQQHSKTHSGEKPFKCDICSKDFSQKSALQMHLGIHGDKKPFECIICSKGFKRKSNLQQHLRIHSEKPFKCDICSKQFTQKSSWQRHLIIHNVENPFNPRVLI